MTLPRALLLAAAAVALADGAVWEAAGFCAAVAALVWLDVGSGGPVRVGVFAGWVRGSWR